MRRITILTVLVVLLGGLLVAPATAQPEGATQSPIEGAMDLTGGIDGDLRVSPGGILHFRGGTAETVWTGDIAGPVTFFYKRVHLAVDESHLVSKGPFEGEVTWNGRTGLIAGMFTTECKPDSDSLDWISCDGTMIGHGSGGLEGVIFHINWGPGFWPFSYDGFALDPHGG